MTINDVVRREVAAEVRRFAGTRLRTGEFMRIVHEVADRIERGLDRVSDGEPLLQLHHAGDWAALYVNGVLDVVGDAYLSRERALELCGVLEVDDDAFMRGQTSRDGVARTLEEVAEYRRTRDDGLARAAQLRTEAERLLARALELGPNPTD